LGVAGHELTLAAWARARKLKAEPEIRNPKLEIRNKFKKLEISETENEVLGLNHRWTRMGTDFTGANRANGGKVATKTLGNFLAGCEQFGLLQDSSGGAGHPKS
jgi:hypothetical protein